MKDTYETLFKPFSYVQRVEYYAVPKNETEIETETESHTTTENGHEADGHGHGEVDTYA